MITNLRLSSASSQDKQKSLLLRLGVVLRETLTPVEWAIFDDEAIECPPSKEELALLNDGYEHRILSDVLKRLDTDNSG